MSLFKKGDVPWNKGKKYKNQKISIANKGRKPTEKQLINLEKGRLFRKGKPLSEVHKNRLSKSHIGKLCGENNGMWKGGISRGYRTKRYIHTKKYKNWRMSVFLRDNFTCQFCGKRGVRIEAHHIKPWAIFPELRFDVSNGVTLCYECHKLTRRRLK